MAKPDSPLPPEVLAAFERRQPIEAIKLLLANRAGLTQSASQQRNQTGATPKAEPTGNKGSINLTKGLSPGEVPKTGSQFWGWAVVALFAYLAYRLVQG